MQLAERRSVFRRDGTRLSVAQRVWAIRGRCNRNWRIVGGTRGENTKGRRMIKSRIKLIVWSHSDKPISTSSVSVSWCSDRKSRQTRGSSCTCLHLIAPLLCGTYTSRGATRGLQTTCEMMETAIFRCCTQPLDLILTSPCSCAMLYQLTSRRYTSKSAFRACKNEESC